MKPSPKPLHSVRGVRTPGSRSVLSSITAALVVFCLAPFALPHANHRDTSTFQSEASLASVIDAHVANHVDWQEVACTPDGEWVIVPVDAPPLYSRGFPAEVRQHIDFLYESEEEIQAVAFTAWGSWTVIGARNFWYSGGIPEAELFHENVIDFWATYGGVSDVAFTERGFVLISKTGAFVAFNVPSDLWDALLDTYSSGRELNHVEIDAQGRWLVTADQWFASDNVTAQMFESFRFFQRSEIRLDHHMIGPGDGFVLFSHGLYQPDDTDPMDLFEYNFVDGKNIWERMYELDVPGTSVAVVEDNRIAHTRGYGVIEGGTQRFVRTSTPFYQGSNSKFLTALTMVKKVDSSVDTGQLALDTSLEEIMLQAPQGALAKWRRAGEKFRTILWSLGYPWYEIPLPTTEITLERLLSMTAGIRVGGGMPAYEGAPYVGTFAQLMGNFGGSFNGNGFAWTEPDMTPGAQFLYSGAGYYIAEAISEQLHGAAFEDVMSQTLFLPLGMTESVAQRRPDAHWDALCSKFHDSYGNPRPGRMETRYVSAGGMYTSSRDYAKALLVVLREGLHPEFDHLRFLSEENADEILTRRPNSETYGLGVGAFGEEFQHTGALGWNYYTAGAKFLAHRANEKGVVFAANLIGSKGVEWWKMNPLMDEGIESYKRAFRY